MAIAVAVYFVQRMEYVLKDAAFPYPPLITAIWCICRFSL